VVSALDAYLLPSSLPGAPPLRRNVPFSAPGKKRKSRVTGPACVARPNEIAGQVSLVQREAGHLAEASEESVRLGALAKTLGDHAKPRLVPGAVPAM